MPSDRHATQHYKVPNMTSNSAMATPRIRLLTQASHHACLVSIPRNFIYDGLSACNVHTCRCCPQLPCHWDHATGGWSPGSCSQHPPGTTATCSDWWGGSELAARARSWVRATPVPVLPTNITVMNPIQHISTWKCVSLTIHPYLLTLPNSKDIFKTELRTGTARLAMQTTASDTGKKITQFQLSGRTAGLAGKHIHK